jgi:hypothetical protein
MIKPDTKKVMARRRWETEEPFTYDTRPTIVISPKYRHKEKPRFIDTVKQICVIIFSSWHIT